MNQPALVTQNATKTFGRRSRQTKWIALILLLLVLAVLGYGAYVYVIAGELKSIEPHFAGSCRAVEGLVGPEDIIVLPDGQTALISTDDVRATSAGQPQPGAILAYDLTADRATPVNLTPDAGHSLHPHGMGLYVAANGATRLFVVNHPEASSGDQTWERSHTIEVYDLVDRKLVYQRTISDDLLISPNDIVPVGPDQFYVTNDHGGGSAFMRELEDYLMLERANVLYYDGARFTVAVEAFLYPNGINISRDGRQIYVASSTGRKIGVFTRDLATGALTESTEIKLGTAPDNIDVDRDGNLWIGAHPKLLTFVSYKEDASRRSPSQVLRLSPDGGASFSASEIFLSDGSDLSASTVGVRYGDRLLIGSVLDRNFLDCRLRS